MAPTGLAAPTQTATRRQGTVLHWLWPVSGATRDIIALDGLRGVAVLLVIVVHMFVWMQTIVGPTGASALNWTSTVWGFGGTGVELFFVLSGFLLFMPYARALLGLKAFPSTRKFYTRRVLRIVPAYWVALIITIIASVQTVLPALRPQSSLEWYNLALHFLFLQNVDYNIDFSMNGVFWSMAVEAQFYLILPLIAMLAYLLVHRGRRTLLWSLVCCGLLLSPATQIVFWLLKSFSPSLFEHRTILAVPEYAIFFLTGMLCSLGYIAATEAGWKSSWLQPQNARIVRRFGLCGAGAIVVYIVAIRGFGQLGAQLADGGPLFNSLFAFSLLALAYGCLLLSALLGNWPWQRMLASKPMRFVGLISYSLYIWHWPLYQHVIAPIAGRFHGDALKMLVFLTLTLLIAFPVGYLSYQFVERPFIRFRLAQH